MTLEIEDLEYLGRDMADEKMQTLLSELHDLADVTQLTAERFV